MYLTPMTCRIPRLCESLCMCVSTISLLYMFFTRILSIIGRKPLLSLRELMTMVLFFCFFRIVWKGQILNSVSLPYMCYYNLWLLYNLNAQNLAFCKNNEAESKVYVDYSYMKLKSYLPNLCAGLLELIFITHPYSRLGKLTSAFDITPVKSDQILSVDGKWHMPTLSKLI